MCCRLWALLLAGFPACIMHQLLHSTHIASLLQQHLGLWQRSSAQAQAKLLLPPFLHCVVCATTRVTLDPRLLHILCFAVCLGQSCRRAVCWTDTGCKPTPAQTGEDGFLQQSGVWGAGLYIYIALSDSATYACTLQANTCSCLAACTPGFAVRWRRVHVGGRDVVTAAARHL
jgi:hypothetical protein